MSEPTAAPASTEENVSKMEFDDSSKLSTGHSKVEPLKEEKKINELPSKEKGDKEPVTNGDHVQEEDAHEVKVEKDDLPDSSTDKEEHSLAKKGKCDTPVELKQPEVPEKEESDSSEEVTASEKETVITQADSTEKDDKMETELSNVTTTESENSSSCKTISKEGNEKSETLKTETTDDTEEKITTITANSGKDDTKTPRAKNNDKDSVKKSKKRKAEVKEEELPTPKKLAYAGSDSATPKKRGARKSAAVVEDEGSIPVPPGWRREVVQRLQGASAGKYDVYYYSPLGKKLRSKVDVRNHCEKNNYTINIDDFVFSKPKGTCGGVAPKPARSMAPKGSKPATPKTPKSPGPKSSKTPKNSKSESTKKKTKIQGKAPPNERAGEDKVIKKVIEEKVEAKVLKKNVNGAQKIKTDNVKKRGNSSKMVSTTRGKKSDEVFKEKIYMKFAFKSRKSGRAPSCQSQS